MKYKILKYNSEVNSYHVCEDENGKIMFLDLVTNCSFPEIDSDNTDVEYLQSLVGKEIEVESTFPYIPLHFAVNVKFV